MVVELPPPPPKVAGETPVGIWVLVDTANERLSVMRDGETLRTFEGLALGSAGAGRKRRRGDRITPVGRFQVGWITRKSRFRIFIGLNYPNLDYAEQGLKEGRISRESFEGIRQALLEGRIPPQDTALGGMIGIHGLGKGDPSVHEFTNWTDGCIAVTNEEIDALASLIKVGTVVEIR